MQGLPAVDKLRLDRLDNAAECRLRIQRPAPVDPPVPYLRSEGIAGPSVLVDRDDIIVGHENRRRALHPAFYLQKDPVKSGVPDFRRGIEHRKALGKERAEGLELVERRERHIFAGDRAKTDHIPKIIDYLAFFQRHINPPYFIRMLQYAGASCAECFLSHRKSNGISRETKTAAAPAGSVTDRGGRQVRRSAQKMSSVR